MQAIAMNTRIKNLTGKVFGKLTVNSFAGTKKGRSYWNCTCECSNKVQIASNNLRKSKENRCGKCTILPLGEALARIIYRDYKTRARIDKMDFALNLDQLKSIISSDCFYCGAAPLNTKTRNGRTYPYNGVDRIDSSKGYTQENSRPCCGICNIMKLDYSEKEFKDHLNKIQKHWAGK